MNFETYFNAYHESYTLWAAYEFGDPMEHCSNHDRRERQYKAFSARILRIDAEKDELEELRTEQWREIMRQAKRIAELEAKIEEANNDIDGLVHRIVELEAENERLRRNNQTFANNAILNEWNTPEEDEAWEDL